jgi:predicted DNA binding protein
VTSIAEFTLRASDFPLGRVFEARPEVTLELDRVVPSDDTVMPYFWVRDPDRDFEGVRAVFADLPELRSITLMDDLGERGLFRAEWQPEYMGIMGAVAESGVTVVSASGSRTGWTFERRATTAEQFSEFDRSCLDSDVDVTLARLSRLSETVPGNGYGLTQEQREALVLAYGEGYYDEPRAVSQEALASRLGVTRQAFSARLR